MSEIEEIIETIEDKARDVLKIEDEKTEDYYNLKKAISILENYNNLKRENERLRDRLFNQREANGYDNNGNPIKYGLR